MIYFDNGATSFPKPKRVATAVQESFTDYGANPGRSGHAMSIGTAVKVFGVREQLADMFGMQSPQEVAFTLNCTHAINKAMKGILREGDHVLISDLEHNAVLRPIHTLASRGLITYSVVETFPSDTMRTVTSFASAIRSETRLVACTHASNVFGSILPIQEIGRLCRNGDIFFLVDAAQSAGVLDIKPRDWGIDFLCLAGHKGLYGPAGTGALITSLGGFLDTIIEGGTGSFSGSYDQPEEMPDRMESGTLSTMGILGLGAGVSFVLEKGVQAIYTHEMKLATETFEALSQIHGVTLYTAGCNFQQQVPVISFNLDGKSSEETVSLLSDRGFALRGGLHCAPLAHQKMGTLETGTARISFGAFNTLGQVHKLLKAIQEIAV